VRITGSGLERTKSTTISDSDPKLRALHTVREVSVLGPDRHLPSRDMLFFKRRTAARQFRIVLAAAESDWLFLLHQIV